ncbi:MAG TPA: DUF2892 domain-containing protein [Solirubrobacterales bacterium]|nr:DUF2892 domain-containing protein [Solirubrobacterales bacterium]
MTTTTASPPKDHPLHNAWRDWPLERVLFSLAGFMTGLSALLSALVSPWFLLLTGFVSLNLLLFATIGNCGASIMLRLVGLRSGCGR